MENKKTFWIKWVTIIAFIFGNTCLLMTSFGSRTFIEGSGAWAGITLIVLGIAADFFIVFYLVYLLINKKKKTEKTIDEKFYEYDEEGIRKSALDFQNQALSLKSEIIENIEKREELRLKEEKIKKEDDKRFKESINKAKKEQEELIKQKLDEKIENRNSQKLSKKQKKEVKRKEKEFVREEKRKIEEKTNKAYNIHKNTQFDQDNDLVYIYTIDNLSCREEGHNIVSIKTKIKTSFETEISMELEYCIDCDLFLISNVRHNELLETYKFIPIRFVLLDETEENNPLYLCGYKNVVNSETSDRERLTMLNFAIKNGIVSRKDVLSIIRALINENKNGSCPEEILDKYNKDFNYIAYNPWSY